MGASPQLRIQRPDRKSASATPKLKFTNPRYTNAFMQKGIPASVQGLRRSATEFTRYLKPRPNAKM